MVEMAITEPTVAFLGPLGTYSHQAVKQYFGPTIRLMPRPTIHSAAMTLLSAPKPDFALIPIRNSTAGPVAETEAILADRTYTSEVKIVDKTKLKALAQCHHALATRYPTVTPLPVPSTAQAAELAADDQTGSTVAIASKVCLEVWKDLEMVEEDVQDEGEANETTFVILARKDAIQ